MKIDRNIYQVPHADITPDPEQPRKVFDEKALQQLSESLSSDGMLSPITIRPNPNADGPRYLLIAGERRWRAAGLLNWDTIPAVIRKDLSDAEAARLQLLENIVRQDLNPVEEARAYQKMLNEGYTMKEISGCVGIPANHITMKVQMLSAREDILELVAQGHIRPLAAQTIGKLSHDNQGRVLRVMTQQRLTWQEVISLCEKIQADESQTEMFTETKLSDDDRRTAQTFGDAFARIGQVLSKLEHMEEKHPGSMAQALAAEAQTVQAQIEQAIKGLNRVRRALQNGRVQQLAEPVPSASSGLALSLVEGVN